MSSNHPNSDLDNLEQVDIPFNRLLVISLVIIIIQTVSGVLIYFSIDDWNSRSNFGEMFGAVDTLFAGLAFAGVIYTILLQKRELELQRRELEMTREELKRSAEAQEKSEAALAKQAEALIQTARINALNLIPALNCSINSQDSKAFLTVANAGGALAFDTDVLAIGIYDEEDIDIPTFFVRYVKKKHRDTKRIRDTVEGFYGVYDHMYYAMFPSRRKIVAPLEFPEPFGVHILLQFRDVQGNNYHQLYWFFSDYDTMPVSWHLSTLAPKVPSLSPRISFDDELNLKTEDNSSFPEYISKEFAVYWSAAISSGYTLSWSGQIEDRGEWHDT